MAEAQVKPAELRHAHLWPRTAVLIVLLLCLPATGAPAQILPSEPIQLADGQIILGGHVAGTISVPDDDGFFNYSDYDHNALRILRLGILGAASAGEHLAILGELQTENWDTLRPFALYARIRPWPESSVDIQVGRIPPTFGAYGRRTYGIGDPLIGYPLSYQYLTSLRADSLPANADDLLRMRGLGWLARYGIGNRDYGRGLPLISALRWDTGVQVRVGQRPLSVSAAVTTGTLANPLVRDDNAGKQVSARVEVTPATGLIVGVSAATGPYVSDRALDDLPSPAGRSIRQNALGVDVEYSRGFWLVRGETILSAWDMPTVDQPFIDDPLRSYGVSVEAQYKIGPGFFAGGRYDYLGFSKITGTLFDGEPTTWDVPVTRIEVGGGYYIMRNVTVKLAYQHNWRDGGPLDRGQGYLATQLSYWF